VHPRETGRRYDAVAAQVDADLRESAYGVRFLEQAIAFCRARRTALDVGCGSGGRMIDRLLSAGFQVTGIDVSHGMLDIARSRHPSVEFVHDDVAEWTPPRAYDLVLAWDSIFHLPYASHTLVLAKLCGCLADGGVLLFTAGGLDGEITGTMHGHAFGYSSLSEVALLRLLHDYDCVPLLMERDQYPLHHVVIIAIKATLPPPQREHLPQDPP
jgi:SAM-dependent methyltransferase